MPTSRHDEAAKLHGYELISERGNQQTWAIPEHRLQLARQAGAKAARAGAKRTDNPEHPTSKLASAWNAGWLEVTWAAEDAAADQAEAAAQPTAVTALSP